MTDLEKIATVQTLVDSDQDATDSVVSVYLLMAANKILARLYPFGITKKEIPETYAVTQCELAARYFLRRGAEGESTHNENGISRTYKSVDDADILDRITPFAKVI